MTRNDYRRIKVALNRPNTLRLIHKSSDTVLDVYHSCEELYEYYGTPYNCPIDFLGYVVHTQTSICLDITDEDLLPF